MRPRGAFFDKLRTLLLRQEVLFIGVTAISGPTAQGVQGFQGPVFTWPGVL